MHRRIVPAVFALALAAALALPGAAFALRAHVRVEGKTATIFGATEPLISVYTGSLAVGDATIDLAQPTPLGVLEAASARGEFFYELKSFSFGPYVSQIGRYPAEGTTGWVFKVNGVSPPVGADAYVLKEGDEVLWYFAQFGIVAGGPPTLDLVRLKRGCFRADEQDDSGTRTAARGVTFSLDGRKVLAQSGRLCPTGSWHQIRAEKGGDIRSQVLLRR